MKRELVKTLRTVCFLAMFSQDSTTVGNIQAALKYMSILEPDLILHPILERAVPALEALVEVCPHPQKQLRLLIFADTTYHRRHQSTGSSGSRYCLSRRILSRSKASPSHSRATATWD